MANINAHPNDKQQHAVGTIDSLEALGYEPDDGLAAESGVHSSASSMRGWFAGKFVSSGF